MRRWRIWRRALAIIAALALVAAFESGVRLLAPGTVRYDIETIEPAGPPGPPPQRGVITDPATVARWRATMTAHPDGTLLHAYQQRWQGNGCSFGTVVVATYTFTWHGLPVEVVSAGPNCAGGYQVWRGLLPDWNTYLIDPLPQP